MTRITLLSLILGLGCSTEPHRPAVLGPRDWSVPFGMKLEQSCTPAGLEQCFDAIDNNCNGLFEEGCGLETGPVQFIIAWSEREADVDLNVYDPLGNLARVGDPTEGGLIKDRDCPKSSNCQGQNFENVFHTGRQAQSGRYRAVIRMEGGGNALEPLQVRFAARVGGEAFGTTIMLTPETPEQAIEFSL